MYQVTYIYDKRSFLNVSSISHPGPFETSDAAGCLFVEPMTSASSLPLLGRKRKAPFFLQQTTLQGVVRSPVVNHLLSKLYGFPFNTSEVKDPQVTFEHICSRYVDVDDVCKDNSTVPDVVIIKSPMGSGKTTFFLRILERFERVLVIGSRRMYCDYMKSVIPGLVSYLDVAGPLSAELHPRLVVQVQSLGRIKKIKTETTYAQWDCIYLDECDSLYKELISEVSTQALRLSCSKYLRKIVSNVGTVVVTDAGLAPWHVNILDEYLLSGLSRRPKLCLVNDYAPRAHKVRVYDKCRLSSETYNYYFVPALRARFGEDVELVDIEKLLFKSNQAVVRNAFVDAMCDAYKRCKIGEDDICTRLYNLLTRGGNAIVVCNTKSQANLVFDVLSRSSIECCLVTGDTPSEERERLMLDPYGSLSKVQCFVYTTCFKVGIDLNFEHFDEVFVLVEMISPNHTPPLIDIYQSVGRARKARSLNVYVQGRLLTDRKYNGKFVQLVDTHLQYCTGDNNTSRDKILLFEEASKPTQLFADEDSINAHVYRMAKMEKSINTSPRLFFDVFMTMIGITLQSSEEPEIVPLIKKCKKRRKKNQSCGGAQEESDEELQFFAQNDDTATDRFVRICKKQINEQLVRYTVVNYDLVKGMLREVPTKSVRKNRLKDILTMLSYFDGTVHSTLTVLRLLDPNELKRWSVTFKKFSYVEPQVPVDMFRFEEEVTRYIDGADLKDKVMRHLYKVNKVQSLRTYDDFALVFNLLLGKLIKKTVDPDDAEFRTEVIDVLSMYLVNGYEVEVNFYDALNALSSVTPVSLKQVFCPTKNSLSYSRPVLARVIFA